MHDTDTDRQSRSWIAIAIVISGLASVLTLGILIVALWDDREKASAFVLSSILPVIGTWVGTILAYYFAKENFETAARNTRAILRPAIEQSTPVRQIMIPREKIQGIQLSKDQKAEDLQFGQLREKFDQYKKGRLPVFFPGGEICYVIHLSVLNEMMMTLVKSGKSLKEAEETRLGELFKVYQKFKVVIEATLAIVREDASVADAKLAMDSTPGSEDVFVTANGRKTDPVVGWVTNNEIGEYATA
jgi:hypothetical protein